MAFCERSLCFNAAGSPSCFEFDGELFFKHHAGLAAKWRLALWRFEC